MRAPANQAAPFWMIRLTKNLVDRRANVGRAGGQRNILHLQRPHAMRRHIEHVLAELHQALAGEEAGRAQELHELIERRVGVELPNLGRQAGEDRHVAEVDFEPDQVGRIGVLRREVDIARAVVGGAARRRPMGRIVDRREAQQATVDAVHFRAERADRRGGRHRVGDLDLVVIVIVAPVGAGHDNIELAVEQIPVSDAGHAGRKRQRDDARHACGRAPTNR